MSSKTVVIALLAYARRSAAEAEYLPAQPVLRSDVPGSGPRSKTPTALRMSSRSPVCLEENRSHREAGIRQRSAVEAECSPSPSRFCGATYRAPRRPPLRDAHATIRT